MSNKLPAGLQCRNGCYKVDKRYNPAPGYQSVRIQVTLGQTSKTVAVQKYNDLMTAEYNRQVNGHASSPKQYWTWHQGVLAYLKEKKILSTSDTMRYFNVLDRYIPANMPLNDICNDTFEKLRDDSASQGLHENRKTKGNKQSATNRYIQVARAVLYFCKTKGTNDNRWVQQDPNLRTHDEEAEKRIPWVLNHEEEICLLDALPDHLADISKFILNTSVRSGEALNLKWKQLHSMPEIGSFFLIPASEHKNKEAKPVYLNAVAEAIINKCHGKHEEYVFTYKGNPIKKMSRTAWPNAMKKAGLWDTSSEALAHATNQRAHYPIPHDLRKTCNTRLKHLGIPLGTRQMILGHTSGYITDDVYTVATLEPFKNALDQLVDKVDQVEKLTLLRAVK